MYRSCCVERNIVSYYGVVSPQLGNSTRSEASGDSGVDRRYGWEGVGKRVLDRNNSNNFRSRLRLFCSHFYNWGTTATVDSCQTSILKAEESHYGNGETVDRSCLIRIGFR